MEGMIVKDGQTLIDIAIQELGSAEGAFDLAVLNGLSVTDDLIPGQELQLPGIVNNSVVSYYSTKNIKPATALITIIQTFDYTFDFTF